VEFFGKTMLFWGKRSITKGIGYVHFLTSFAKKENFIAAKLHAQQDLLLATS
jgi:hypothetical protein